MNTHWKSSENPLYVRIVWKKSGIRHALLNNETRTHSFHFRNSSPFQQVPSSSPAKKFKINLDTCLARTKLDTSKLSALNRPACIIHESRLASLDRTKFNSPSPKCAGNTNPIMFFVECLENNTVSSGDAKNDWSDDDLNKATFADRITRWLQHSSNVLSHRLNEGTFETRESDRKFRKKNRPTTATPIRKNYFRYQNNKRSLSEESNAVEKDNLFGDSKSLFASHGRPQLHVYIPTFEEERELNFSFE